MNLSISQNSEAPVKESNRIKRVNQAMNCNECFLILPVLKTTISKSKNPISHYKHQFKIKAFISADIPFSKLRNKHLQKLFNNMKFPLPSETSCRDLEKKVYENSMIDIKNYLSNRNEFFMIVDETSLKGLANKPDISYLVCCDFLEKSPNNNYIKNKISGVISYFNLKPENFILLLSDAASYMKLGGLKLKNESFNFDNGKIVHFHKLFHITCIVHLYHNITGKIISHYSNINELIISINIALSKCASRKKLYKNSLATEFL
ncbi:hypothetical protein A3Q56_02421 [Intoshia linei]|uniref:DUF659 domain-containing protein n=1 Tax=Intoshia linei TaxID=1819745 RepID=A0A177B6E2_9BILA|nr:hypothetical protein A3Q56_02421 [Intoshia linei]